MKKKTKILIGVLLCMIFSGILLYKFPVRLTSLNPDEVSEIYVFSGMTGKELHITEREEIEHIINNFNTIKLQKDGISMFRMGYRLNLTIYLKDGTTAHGMNDFIMNGPTIRKDPFFYKVVEGSLDYSYIENLADLTGQQPSDADSPVAAETTAETKPTIQTEISAETAPSQAEGIPFRYLHRGFTAIQTDDQESFEAFSSIGQKVILNEADWQAYMAQFCPGIPYFDSFDFSKECLLTSVVFGARPAYVQAGLITRLTTENGCFVFEYDDTSTDCLALNSNNTTHFYVDVLIINRDDLPDNFEGLVYHAAP